MALRVSSGIIIEDVADIGGCAVATAYRHTNERSFPPKLGRVCGRNVWNRKSVVRWYRNRVDGRITANRRNARKRRRARK